MTELDSNDLELIKSQSGCDDDEKIKDLYKNLDQNLTNTIIRLLNVPVAEITAKQPKKLDEELREIMDSKEFAYENRQKHEIETFSK